MAALRLRREAAFGGVRANTSHLIARVRAYFAYTLHAIAPHSGSAISHIEFQRAVRAIVRPVAALMLYVGAGWRS